MQQIGLEEIPKNPVGTFTYKDGDGKEYTDNGFLIKHVGVTMLFTWADKQPSSGSFKLYNGTQLQINCDKSNWLDIGEYSIFGMSEHLDKIGDAGFQLYQKIQDVPEVKVGDTLLIGLGDKQIQRKVKEIDVSYGELYYDEDVSSEYWGMPVTTTNNINTIIGWSGEYGVARRVTIEDIENDAKLYSDVYVYPTFESFLNHLKNKKK